MKCGQCAVFNKNKPVYKCPVILRDVTRNSECSNLEALAGILESLSRDAIDSGRMDAREREMALLWMVASACLDIPDEEQPESLRQALKELNAEIDKNDRLQEMMEAKDGD